MGIRRIGREAAVRILYTMEFSEITPDEAAREYWQNNKGSAKLKEHTLGLVNGVCGVKDKIDKLISKSSENWKIERMPEVDRSILRLAAYEMTECGDVPSAVAINEAVEIAKRYASKESASFINGILGRIDREPGD